MTDCGTKVIVGGGIYFYLCTRSCEGTFLNTHNSILNFLFAGQLLSGLPCFILFKFLGQASLAGLFVQRRQVLSGFFHHLYSLVE